MAKPTRVLNYYGSKVAAAKRYPAPQHDTIVEPFCGGAGYSLLHRRKQVILIDRNPDVTDAWSYLIATEADEIRRLPLLQPGDPVPAEIGRGAGLLIGWATMMCGAYPQSRLTPCAARVPTSFWCAQRREALATLSDEIRHWQVWRGDYKTAPPIEATWFIDSPYAGKAGSHYPHSSKAIDYAALAHWCCERQGQTIVCEGPGADWLPFVPYHTHASAPTADVVGRRISSEWIWLSDNAAQVAA